MKVAPIFSSFASDESRFGIKTLITRVITLFGVKPVAPVEWSRENFWLYGAVEPISGEHFFYEFSHQGFYLLPTVY